MNAFINRIGGGMASLLRRYVPQKWNARPTLIDLLIVVAIIAVAAAFLLPAVKWASSGSLVVPVQVTVFDVLTAQPIEGASIAIVRGVSTHAEFTLEEYSEYLRWGADPEFSGMSHRHVPRGGSGTNGIATIPVEFNTGASHNHPEARAHTNWYWLIVQAPGYSGVAVPLTDRPHATKDLKSSSTGLQTMVGLISEKAGPSISTE
jgi:hypothetical protein